MCLVGAGCGLAIGVGVGLRGGSAGHPWTGILVGSIVGMAAALIAGTLPLGGMGGLILPLLGLAVGLIDGFGGSSFSGYRDVLRETFIMSVLLAVGLVPVRGSVGWSGDDPPGGRHRPGAVGRAHRGAPQPSPRGLARHPSSHAAGSGRACAVCRRGSSVGDRSQRPRRLGSRCHPDRGPYRIIPSCWPSRRPRFFWGAPPSSGSSRGSGCTAIWPATCASCGSRSAGSRSAT